MAPKESYNRVKFQNSMTHEINILLRQEFSDPRLQFVTITHVELNKDYSLASVYWDTFDSNKRGDIKVAIEGVSKKMRSKLAQKLKLRHTPALKFLYNSQYEEERKIEKLLQDT